MGFWKALWYGADKSPHRGWDKIPHIKGCWANTSVEERRGGQEEDKKGEWVWKPVLSCASSPPSHIQLGFTLRNLTPVVLHRFRNWPYQWDLFAKKGRHLDRDYHRPRPPCLSSSGLPKMLLLAKLQQLQFGLHQAAMFGVSRTKTRTKMFFFCVCVSAVKSVSMTSWLVYYTSS